MPTSNASQHAQAETTNHGPNADLKSDLSLAALVILAQFHGIAINAGDIQHRYDVNGLGLDQSSWLLAAREIGLKAKVSSQKLERLHMASLPALVWREDGQHFILAKVDDERYLIQDLVQGRPVILTKEEFTGRYSGVLILVASRASILGSLAKFDFTWFIPAVIKYRRIFMEVLAVSVVIQLFALITPIWLCRIKARELILV